MQKRGHKVSLVAPRESQIFKRSEAAGIPCLPMSFKRSAWARDFFILKRFFKKESVAVLNPHSSRDGWLAGLAGRSAGVPLILRSRHIEVDYPNRFTSRIAFGRLPHHVLTTSDKIKNRLITELSLKPADVTTIATGIDIEIYSGPRISTIRKELKIASDVPIIGMVTVLRSWKGHPFFLEAAYSVLKSLPDTVFVIAGDGPQRENIERKIIDLGLTSNVLLLGHRSDVENILKGLNALVLPSTAHEGIPQIILQAHASQTPVIGTNVGGIPEVVCHMETGLIIPHSDSTALAAAILEVLQNPSASASRAAKGNVFVAREHSQAVMAKKLEAIYNRYCV